MTDDSATLRALDDIALLTRWGASRAAERPLDGFEILALKIAVSQSSWAKEKATLQERIDNAMQSASETAPDWGTRFYRVMSALGADFGGPEAIERGIRADYARLLGYECEEWAKEKAELERQLSEADAVISSWHYPNCNDKHKEEAKVRHASRPAPVKD